MPAKVNIYDRILFLLIVSLIFGNYGGIFFSPTHILAYVCSPVIIKEFSETKRSPIKNILIVALIMLMFSFFSLLWTPDDIRAKDAMTRLLIHLILFLEIVIVAFNAKNPITTIVNAWICSIVLTSIIAAWEISTDQHLTNAREVAEYRDQLLGVEKHVAEVTFYNNNTYSLFLIMSLPFLLYKLFSSRTFVQTLLMSIIFFVLVVILLFNASRGSLISVGVMIAFYVWFSLNSKSKKKKYYLFFLIIIVSSLLFYYSDVLFEAILNRSGKKGMFEDNIRSILFESAWNLFLSSKGIGLGIGSMQYSLNAYSGNITDINYCHNLVLELLLEGGVLFGMIFFSYIFFLYKCVRGCDNNKIKMVIYGSLMAFPFYSIINSQYLPPTFIWVFFASLYVFASISLNNYKLKMSKKIQQEYK